MSRGCTVSDGHRNIPCQDEFHVVTEMYHVRMSLTWSTGCTISKRVSRGQGDALYQSYTWSRKSTISERVTRGHGDAPYQSYTWSRRCIMSEWASRPHGDVPYQEEFHVITEMDHIRMKLTLLREWTTSEWVHNVNIERISKFNGSFNVKLSIGITCKWKNNDNVPNGLVIQWQEPG